MGRCGPGSGSRESSAAELLTKSGNACRRRRHEYRVNPRLQLSHMSGGEVLWSPMTMTVAQSGPRRLGRLLGGARDLTLPLLSAVAVPRRASKDGAIVRATISR